MKESADNRAIKHDDIWIISKGRYWDKKKKDMNIPLKGRPVMEYRISELTKYMLNPYPIEVNKKLIGCEVRHNQCRDNRKAGITSRFRNVFKNNNHKKNKSYISEFNRIKNHTESKSLEDHINSFYSMLNQFDPVVKNLQRLDRVDVSDIVGICEEDVEGNRSWLNLKGSIDEKLNYVINNLGNVVGVVLDKAYIADSLFEMRGFDFNTFNSNNVYRMIKVIREEKPRFYVFDLNNNVEYWIDDIRLIHYMHLLEQSIKANFELYSSFKACMDGEAQALKLFFRRQLEIDYSRARLPEIYKTVFNSRDINKWDKELFLDSLKKMQFGISFQYVPRTGSDEECLLTNISVLHDFKALEPIKDEFPWIYSEIDKRTSVSEVGKYYLLDSIKGYKNEQ